ncbi:9038_t:CDS:2 [Ambispora leptoticha]|uniref:9038_t:CDS:1 n=1 Tax=Ambispora leptoticha TaxID=144679 RepID=A0A9N9A7V8_9GLOM|nr:9038_t:CDS:2 [Ambispora leptoticha]
MINISSRAINEPCKRIKNQMATEQESLNDAQLDNITDIAFSLAENRFITSFACGFTTHSIVIENDDKYRIGKDQYRNKKRDNEHRIGYMTFPPVRIPEGENGLKIARGPAVDYKCNGMKPGPVHSQFTGKERDNEYRIGKPINPFLLFRSTVSRALANKCSQCDNETCLLRKINATNLTRLTWHVWRAMTDEVKFCLMKIVNQASVISGRRFCAMEMQQQCSGRRFCAMEMQQYVDFMMYKIQKSKSSHARKRYPSGNQEGPSEKKPFK